MFHQNFSFCSIIYLVMSPVKIMWCHLKNFFKPETKMFILALLAVVGVTVLALLPDYPDGHDNVS